MKKTISKLLCATLALTMVFSLASCSKNNKDKVLNVTNKALEALVKYDTGKIDKYITCPNLTEIREGIENIEGADKCVAALFAGMKYELSEVVIDEDPGIEGVKATATVEATVTNKNLQGDAAQYLLKMFNKLGTKEIDLTDKSYLEGQAKEILAYINSDKVSERTTAVTFSLENGKGGWKLILSGNAESAAFCGAISSVKNIVIYVGKAEKGELNFTSASDAS